MTHPNEAAFAQAGFADPNGNISYPEPGLTKRELFAAMAMQGLGGNSALNQASAQNIACWAVECADALIAELNKEPPR